MSQDKSKNFNPTVDPKGKTWRAAAAQWVAVGGRSESDLFSLAKFGRLYPDRPLSDVTGESVGAVLDSFCKTAGTYTRYRTTIAAVLNLAKSNGWVRDVPKLPERKAPPKAAPDWITREQWDRLHAELPPHLRAMATFAISTGLRQANLLGLMWMQVDVAAKTYWADAEDAGIQGYGLPLSPAAVAVLNGQRGQHDEFVFTFRGEPINEVKTAYIAACVRAGLGMYNGKKYVGFTWQGLRDTWATWNVQNGMPLDVLQWFGGWRDKRMVMVFAEHSPPGPDMVRQ